ncbi:hypothetical protein BKA69DRAFT_928294 [Paraphysoderma sedebokerense]|nr:hypothetical protein BKA69DRAFT_928294 [Paraphysoderma sedebokerense]
MSLNWALLEADGKTPVPLPGEKIYFTQNGVRFEFESGNGYPGLGGNYYAKTVILYLTSLRVIIVAAPLLQHFKSLSVPLKNLSNMKLHQPWFGANYWTATVTPVPDGGLTMPGEVRLYFHEGGAFEYQAMFTNVVSREIPDLQTQLIAEEALPVYTPPSSSATPGTSLSAPNNHPNQSQPTLPTAVPPQETSLQEDLIQFSTPATNPQRDDSPVTDDQENSSSIVDGSPTRSPASRNSPSAEESNSRQLPSQNPVSTAPSSTSHHHDEAPPSYDAVVGP